MIAGDLRDVDDRHNIRIIGHPVRIDHCQPGPLFLSQYFGFPFMSFVCRSSFIPSNWSHIALRRYIPAFKILDYVGHLEFVLSGFLSVVDAGDQAIIQKMLCSLFTDVADSVELVLGNHRWIFLEQIIVFTVYFLH